MTDSESDVGAIQLRNRLLELVYTSGAVFTISQLALILAVERQGLCMNSDDQIFRGIVYDQDEETVHMRPQHRMSPSDTILSGKMPTSRGIRRSPGIVETRYANYGSDGYHHYRRSAFGGWARGFNKECLSQNKNIVSHLTRMWSVVTIRRVPCRKDVSV
ncbi:hypothetical protein C4B63_170g31, partial [Trypanosoma cruzi]